MRSVLFRFPDAQVFEHLVSSAGAEDLELSSPSAEPFEDGEWLLAVFEVGPQRRATSAAARAASGPDGAFIILEPRDCKKLAEFARLYANRPPLPEAPEPPRTERSASTPPPPVRPTPTPTPPRGTLPSGAGSRVLVVDDDETIRDMVCAMLEAVGLFVTAAPNAEDALVLLRDMAFDLVVLDWNMPRMTGLALCRALRQRSSLAGLPILFLTANTSPSDMVEAFAAGADDYVVKPFRAPELGARIFSLLRRARLSAPS